jgi:hypothetical protein
MECEEPHRFVAKYKFAPGAVAKGSRVHRLISHLGTDAVLNDATCQISHILVRYLLDALKVHFDFQATRGRQFYAGRSLSRQLTNRLVALRSRKYKMINQIVVT